MDLTPDLDIEIEVSQRAGTGYPIRQSRDTAELRWPEGEVAPSRPGSVGKVRRELERLGQPRSRIDRALKCAFDLAGGAVLLIVLAPVLLTISLLIKMDSPVRSSSVSGGSASTGCRSECSSSARWWMALTLASPPCCR